MQGVLEFLFGGRCTRTRRSVDGLYSVSGPRTVMRDAIHVMDGTIGGIKRAPLVHINSLNDDLIAYLKSSSG